MNVSSYPPTVATAARNAFRQQAQLRSLLSQMEKAFVRSPARTGAGPDVIAARLDHLRGQLQALFDEEERALLFETIEAHAPEHGTDCTRLREEHRVLVTRLDGLRVASPEGRRGGGWFMQVRQFLDDLVKHEDREAELLHRALDGGTSQAD
jgi:hypothetical protein